MRFCLPLAPPPFFKAARRLPANRFFCFFLSFSAFFVFSFFFFLGLVFLTSFFGFIAGNSDCSSGSISLETSSFSTTCGSGSSTGTMGSISETSSTGSTTSSIVSSAGCCSAKADKEPTMVTGAPAERSILDVSSAGQLNANSA